MSSRGGQDSGQERRVTPSFDFSSPGVRLASYVGREERERFLLDTFGSQECCGTPRTRSGSTGRAGSWSAPSSGCRTNPPPPRTAWRSWSSTAPSSAGSSPIPARYLTTAYAAPDPALLSPATRRLLSACLDLITDPLLEEVQDREPAALARRREVHRSLCAQREDRHRADALLSLIGNLVEDYGDR